MGRYDIGAIGKDMQNLSLSLDFILSEIKHNWKILSREMKIFDLHFRKISDSCVAVVDEL